MRRRLPWHAVQVALPLKRLSMNLNCILYRWVSTQEKKSFMPMRLSSSPST